MTDPTPDRPLVTFALFAYNQEDYIREAVEGAFAQTYEPLEIILSDDCSSDGTFEIMQEMAAAYEGPHTIRLRRSEINKGLIHHINSASKEFSGQIVIVGAGDDISSRRRVERCIAVFTSDIDLAAVYTDFEGVDVSKRAQENESDAYFVISMYEIVLQGGGVGKGATYAYKKSCFNWPGPLNENLYSEDRILPMRAAALGKVAYLPETTVFYHESQDSLGNILRQSGKLPFSYWPHICELRKELRFFVKASYISATQGKKLIATLLLRHHLSGRKHLEHRSLSLLKRGIWRVIYRMLTLLVPKREMVYFSGARGNQEC